MGLKLLAGYAFLGVQNDSQGHEPLCQGNMAVIEDRAIGSGELLFAGGFEALIDARTLVLALRLASDPADMVAAAYRAADAVRPAHRLKVG